MQIEARCSYNPRPEGAETGGSLGLAYIDLWLLDVHTLTHKEDIYCEVKHLL